MSPRPGRGEWLPEGPDESRSCRMKKQQQREGQAGLQGGGRGDVPGPWKLKLAISEAGAITREKCPALPNRSRRLFTRSELEHAQYLSGKHLASFLQPGIFSLLSFAVEH